MRSTKVGRLTPTTGLRSRACSRQPSSLNEGREVNPDDRMEVGAPFAVSADRSTKVGRLTPTTVVSMLFMPSVRITLNEGREVNPDDSAKVPGPHGRAIFRSTKVGRLTPTTVLFPTTGQLSGNLRPNGASGHPCEGARQQISTLIRRKSPPWCHTLGTAPQRNRISGRQPLNHWRFADRVRATKVALARGPGHVRGATWSRRFGQRSGTH